MNIGVVIQARMGSKRLPGKVLLAISGKTILQHIFWRLDSIRVDVRVIVATSDKSEDDVISKHCQDCNVPVFRGSESDVLDRYYKCAVSEKFDNVVRLTADNPFPDVDELENLITNHLEFNYDYSHSFGILPIGVGAEIITFTALEKIWQAAVLPAHREHINDYIYDNLEKFKVGNINIGVAKRAPTLRLTVDTEEDYEYVCSLAGKFPVGYLKTEEAIKLASRFV